MRISPFGDFIEFGDFTDSLRVDIQSCGDASYPGSWSFQVISCHTWCQFLGYKSNRIKDTSGIIKPTEFGSRRDRLHSGRVYIVHDLEFMALTWAPAGIARAHLCRVHFCSELLTDILLSVWLDSVGQPCRHQLAAGSRTELRAPKCSLSRSSSESLWRIRVLSDTWDMGYTP